MSMSDAMRDQLERAYNLIQQDQLDAAVSLLRPVVARDPDNPDAWWLLANAVSEPHDAYNALTNVLRLEPDHDQAKELLDNLLQEFPELAIDSAAGADLFSTAASGLRSTQPGTTDWDAEFTDSTGLNSATSDLDDLFRNYDANATDLDIGSITASEPLDVNETVSAAGYQLDTYFTPDTNDAEDLDAMFSSNVRNVPATRTEENDLDALFGVKPEPKTEELSTSTSGDAFNDPFGANDPDFLDDVIFPTEVAATVASEDKRRTQTGKKTTRPAGAVPKGDPFAPAASSRRRSPILPILGGLLLVAAIAVVALLVLRPSLFNPTAPTEVATNPTSEAVGAATSEVPTNDATLDASINGMVTALPVLAEAQDAFISANFSSPVATLENGTFTVSTCELPSRNLRSRLNEALDLIAGQAAKLRDQVEIAKIELRDCVRTASLLYRASAPIDAVISYVDGGQTDVAAYRAAWVAN